MPPDLRRSFRNSPARLLPSVFAALLLAGCQTTSLSRAPDASGQPILAAELAAGLDQRALAMAADAERRALDAGIPGAPVAWKRSDSVSGVVVPQQTFFVGARSCRGVIHTVTQSGASRSASVTACRQVNGSWQVLS
jgi:surface antigen